MNDAGFDVLPMEMDLANRTSIQNLITEAQKYGEIMMLISAAGVSPLAFGVLMSGLVFLMTIQTSTFLPL